MQKRGTVAEAKVAVPFAAQNDLFKFAFLFDITTGMELVAMPDHQVPEFVVTGAELGEKLYKKLYPLSD